MIIQDHDTEPDRQEILDKIADLASQWHMIVDKDVRKSLSDQWCELAKILPVKSDDQ
jgi:hypothetical protein